MELLVVAITEFIGPWQGGELSERSKVRVSSALVTVRRMASGASMTPSESTQAGCCVDAVRQFPDLGAHLPGCGGTKLLDGGLDGGTAIAVEKGPEAAGTHIRGLPPGP
jgi:hypothetical protein